jgi:topoisomerase-4 subunit B
MYIGGTDERALQHLVAEVLDNAMDEAIAGHASWIELELDAQGFVTVRDNGRGIPVDPHPKFKNKTALEVILTMLHTGGKFGGSSYITSGGLHGVGLSVVNALSDSLTVEVARDRVLWAQEYSRGVPRGKLRRLGSAANRRGTLVRFHPDPQIFGPDLAFQPAALYALARDKAYLFRGVEIRWRCAKERLGKGRATPEADILHYPGGLTDFLASLLGEDKTGTAKPFTGEATFADGQGRVEWAVAFPLRGEGVVHSYCNTVPTPEGGSHEQGLRAALVKGLKGYGEFTSVRQARDLSAEDVMEGTLAILSLFLRSPQFQGQTKERLSNPEAVRLIEPVVRDHFDHWLSADPAAADALLAGAIERAEERARRRQEKEISRKAATRKLRLPGKLTDCTRAEREGTEIFLVEGDSAGGSAKQARRRDTQAVLPLRGKILNVANASADKVRQNQELNDLVQALGCGSGKAYDDSKLRYERVIIMTDADVDGAHIASLLMTFFYREMPSLIERGHLYLAQPPLYRLGQGPHVIFARDDAERDRLIKTAFNGRGTVDVSRFKGLGEMPAHQLKETTMDPAKRHLWRVVVTPDEAKRTARQVERLMGRKPELRFAFIQEHAKEVRELDI